MKRTHTTNNELGLLFWPVEAQGECLERAMWPQAAASKLCFQIIDSQGANVLGEEHILCGYKNEYLN